MDKTKEKFKDIGERCLGFSVEIIKLVGILPRNTAAFVIGKQIVRSSGSIGANVTEARSARTKREFISSMNIALKEADETIWWLNVIMRAGLAEEKYCLALIKECTEIAKILTTIIKNTKQNLDRNS